MNEWLALIGGLSVSQQQQQSKSPDDNDDNEVAKCRSL